jgi:hypothetical protein
MHRKYNTTWKNVRQIALYSLGADLHIEINLTPFCSIKHCTKLHKIKTLEYFSIRYVHVHTLSFCMHVHVMLIS